MGLDISCIINVDTRPTNLKNKEMFNGVVSRDFLVEGVYNKIKLFDGFEKEIIVFVDEHEPIPEKILASMRKLCDTLIIRKHDKRFEDNDNFAPFNDFNYLQALFHARGTYLFHFDADVAAFTESPEPIKEQMSLLEHYDFVSYPSHWSPTPVDDASFEGKYWVSTRYFCCKRSTLDFTEIMKCQLDYDYWRTTYPRARLCHWLEHILQSVSKKGVYYPPLNFERFILYVWENYEEYILQRLNNQTFEEVNKWVTSQIYHYPNNLTLK